MALAICVLVACARTPAAPSGGARPPFEAARLKTGRFFYRTTDHGEDAGSSNISIARVDASTYRFANEVLGKFRQSWEARTTPALEPLSATLGLGANDDKGRTMRLAYAGQSVKGTATKGARTDEVSAELPADVVDQRIDWAALMSAPLTPGGAIAFTVYDPWSGVSRVDAHVLGQEQQSVPAGTFDTLRVVYRIAKRDRGDETYEIWVNRTEPRFLVREDFPNGATTELVSVTD
jgi:hypothetical protein